jgi:DNA-binding transcriptional ArsR family regulator
MPALTPVVARRVTDPRDRHSEIEFRADDPRDATAVRSRASTSGTGSFAGPTVPMADEAPDAFEALLGWQRARILKGLDGAQRPGQIAEALRMVPAGATHHLSRLEAAGLVIRKLRLFLHPVAVGSGHRLFENGDVLGALKLSECRAYDNGVVSLNYEPAAGR